MVDGVHPLGRLADVVLFSALAVEHRAVVDVLSEIDPFARRVGDECVAMIGPYRVVAVPLTSMGNVGAAAGAQRAVHAWKPAHLLLIGIAAGLGDGASIALGDVLVADTVVGYEAGKHAAGGFQHRPDVYRSAFALLSAARTVTAEQWMPFMRTPRPDGDDGSPGVHVGTVLTGEKVLADAEALTALRRAWPSAVGVEMEGLGVATVSYRNNAGFLLIKGISDFADGAKNDLWQAYAVEAAARFAVAMLRQRPFEPRGSSDDFRPAGRDGERLFEVASVPGGCRIGLLAGGIVGIRTVDVWVNSENTDMEMSRTNDFTVSGIIRYWGARRDGFGRVTEDVIADELARRAGRDGPVAPGTAIVTGSGSLADSHHVRHIIHVASVAGEPGAGFRQVRSIGLCVTNVLAETDRLASADPEVRTVLFPLLGAGAGAGKIEPTVAEMIDAMLDYVTTRRGSRLAAIYLLGYSTAEFAVIADALAGNPRLVAVAPE